MTNKNETIIEFVDVWKKFSAFDNPTLAGISLQVKKGHVYTLLGFSGTGKSVSIKHALGLMKADSGKVIVKGKDVANLNDKELQELRKSYGMLFQDIALFDSLNVFENVAFPIREHKKKWSEEQITSRVKDLLNEVELEGIFEKMPSELSGGMRKRVGLARAMALEPEILFCDEPTTGLDPVTAQKIDDLIYRTAIKRGVTVFMISHDIRAALKISHRVAMLWKGKILFEETPEKFIISEEKVVKEFLESAGVL